MAKQITIVTRLYAGDESAVVEGKHFEEIVKVIDPDTRVPIVRKVGGVEVNSIDPLAIIEKGKQEIAKEAVAEEVK